MRGIGDLLDSLYLLLPHWLFWPVVGALVAVVFPLWLRGRQVKSLRAGVQRRVRMEGQRRERKTQELLTRAGTDVRKLEALAGEALRLEQEDLLRLALERLDESESGRMAAKRLRDQRAREKKAPAHPLLEELAIRRLLDEGLLDLAQARLDEVKAHYADNAQLDALADELARAREAGTPDA